MNQPRKDDEKDLWDAVIEGEKPREAGARLGVAPNRVRYLCYKWARAGIYDWGISHDLGWPIPQEVQDARAQGR